MINKRMLILPTFDGQTRDIAVVDADSIEALRASMTPGMCNVYLTGSHDSNVICVALEPLELIKALKSAGVSMQDLSGGQQAAQRTQNNDH